MDSCEKHFQPIKSSMALRGFLDFSFLSWEFGLEGLLTFNDVYQVRAFLHFVVKTFKGKVTENI